MTVGFWKHFFTSHSQPAHLVSWLSCLTAVGWGSNLTDVFVLKDNFLSSYLLNSMNFLIQNIKKVSHTRLSLNIQPGIWQKDFVVPFIVVISARHLGWQSYQKQWKLPKWHMRAKLHQGDFQGAADGEKCNVRHIDFPSVTVTKHRSSM